MLDPNRDQLLKTLVRLSERYPQMRSGQLVCNLASWASNEPDVWEATDEELLEAARSHLAQHQDTSAKK